MPGIVKTEVGFPLGFLWSRWSRQKPLGSVEDGENMELLPDFAAIRAGTELAYTNDLDTGAGTFRLVALKALDFTGGDYWLTGLLDTGTAVRFQGRDIAAAATPSGLTAGGSWHGDMVLIGDTAWLTCGSGLPMKFTPTAASGDRDMWAGCPGPYVDDDDLAITLTATYSASSAGIPGLAAGHYYYAVTILYGQNGKWGESTLGAVTTFAVPASQTADVVSTTLPIAGGAYIPAGTIYDGAWGRRVYRTLAGGEREGPYFFLNQVNDMTSVSFRDRLADADLSNAVISEKYLFDDPKTPPPAQFAIWHNGRVVYARTIEFPNRVWWSEPNRPDLVPATNAEDIRAESGDPITGLQSFRGSLYVLTPSSVTEARIADFGAFRTLESRYGCVAPKSLAVGRNEVLWLSREGVISFSGGSPERVGGQGGEDVGRRIYEFLLEYCSNLRLASAVVSGDLYCLSYPDRRDVPVSGQGNTRTLKFNLSTGVWYPPDKGYYPGVWCLDKDRLLFAEARFYPRVLQVNSFIRTDYNMNGGTNDKIRGRLLIGNLNPAPVGRGVVPLRVRCDADVYGNATTPLYLFPVSDGTEGTYQKLYAGNGFYGAAALATTTTASRRPDEFRFALAREFAREFRLEVKNQDSGGTVNDLGRWAVHGLEVEMSPRVF